jgi:hypothetical protein
VYEVKSNVRKKTKYNNRCISARTAEKFLKKDRFFFVVGPISVSPLTHSSHTCVAWDESSQYFACVASRARVLYSRKILGASQFVAVVIRQALYG